MRAKTLSTLEFPRIIDRLAQYANFSVSHAKIMALLPDSDLQEIRRQLALTTEGVNLLNVKSDFTIGGAKDVRAAARRCAIGVVLEASSFIQILDTLQASRNVRRTITRLNEQLDEKVVAGSSRLFPNLFRLSRNLVELTTVEDTIATTLNDKGEVLDSASDTLRLLRTQIRQAHSRLIDRLNNIIANERYARMIQEPILTMRDGRYVIPVKADFKGQFRGIIHDQSASGATVFMEPLATIDLSNQWKQLQIEEVKEIERVLLALGQKVGVYADPIIAAVEALGEIDFVIAKARYAIALRGVEPRMELWQGVQSPDPAVTSSKASDPAFYLDLIEARHPLLTGNVVPITLRLGEDFRILVITGPNTGGKTVTLKTVGLLTLMAQAGLHIPAEEGSALFVYGEIYADIGDEQSIEQSLSTFSSHISNIKSILADLHPAALVLLDELGAGTDPTEGAALARSIIEYILRRGVLSVITTHYAELKAFAYDTPQVQNASVEFDLETLSPTYRLSLGLPGRSNALAIAARLGLPEEIIKGAEELVSPEARHVETLLENIEAERNEAKRLREEIEREKNKARNQRFRLDEQMRRIDQQRRRILAEARAQARQELEEIRENLKRLNADVNNVATTRDQLRQAEEEARNTDTALRSLPKLEEPPSPPPVVQPVQETLADKGQSPRPLRPGDRVLIKSIGEEGDILTISDGSADVQMGAFKLRRPLQDLTRSKTALKTERTVNYRASALEVEAPSMQFDIRGWRAEEVAAALDRYLNDAYLSGLSTVRIVHGKGTGALRQVVRQYLSGHPLVRSHETGANNDGGDGVTMVNLAH